MREKFQKYNGYGRIYQVPDLDCVFWSRACRNLFNAKEFGSDMIMEKKNKKGEMTTKQLVTIIILILSFSVILFLIFRLDLGTTSNKEICRNSVLLSEKTDFKSSPLDCRTNYLCISSDGECEGFSSTSEVKATTKNETMKALAEEMADCWWMFGEGEIDYVSKFPGLLDKNVCAVCSLVSFEGLDEEITHEEFYMYLSENKKSSSQTYSQYLYASNDLSDLRGLFPKRYFENNLDLSKEYFILTGRFKSGIITEQLNPFSSKFWTTEYENFAYPVYILENTPENYEKIGCEEFITKA